MRRGHRQGFSLIELLTVVAIISILVAITLPTLHWARESARRAECQSNLRQVGIGLHSFHDQNGTLPPYFGIFPPVSRPPTWDEETNGPWYPSFHKLRQTAVFGSWVVHSLPFLGNEALWEAINDDVKEHDSNWDDYVVTRIEREWNDAEFGYVIGGSGSDEFRVTETERILELVDVHHAAVTDYEWNQGDGSSQYVRVDFGSEWFGHSGDGESPFMEVVNEGWYEPVTVQEAYTTQEEILRTYNNTVFRAIGTSGGVFGDIGNSGYYSYDFNNEAFTAGGISNNHAYSFELLQCPSDPSLYQGFNQPQEKYRFPASRPDLKRITELLAAGKWGTTNYVANWNSWTNGNPFEAPFNAPVEFGMFHDGTSNTMLVGEVYSNCDRIPRIAMYNGAYFHMFGLNYIKEANTLHYQSAPPVDKCNNWRAQSGHMHMNILLADGSVKTVSHDIETGEIIREKAGMGSFGVDPEPRRLSWPDEIAAEEQKYTDYPIDDNFDGEVDLDEDGRPAKRRINLLPKDYKAWDMLMLPRDGMMMDEKEKYFF